MPSMLRFVSPLLSSEYLMTDYIMINSRERPEDIERKGSHVSFLKGEEVKNEIRINLVFNLLNYSLTISALLKFINKTSIHFFYFVQNFQSKVKCIIL
jgi:hypothetical protein